MRIERMNLSEWGRTLPETAFEPFHDPEALGVVDQHSSGTLHFLGGFKGEEPVGLIPVHEHSKFGARVLTSPPLGFGIGRLGPVVVPTSPKQRKRETTNKKFIHAVIEELDADSPRTLLRFSCSPDYTDPRPFQWEGFDISPAFTYRIMLRNRDEDELLQSFSRDLRKDIRKREDVDISIRTGGIEDVRKIHGSITERYQEQGYRVPLSWEFVRDLIQTLEERSRVYVAESADGEFISGILILYSNDTASFWKGGAKTDRTVSPNSLLHWQIIVDILNDPALESIEKYDMYTANNERLTRYKSSFGGELKSYYTVESNGAAMLAAKGLYRMLAFKKNPLGKRGQL